MTTIVSPKSHDSQISFGCRDDELSSDIQKNGKRQRKVKVKPDSGNSSSSSSSSSSNSNSNSNSNSDSESQNSTLPRLSLPQSSSLSEWRAS